MNAPTRPAPLPVKVFGWDSCKLADAYDIETLVKLRAAVEDDPFSANPCLATGSIWRFTKAARAKLDKIDWAITYRLGDLKKAAPVPPAYATPPARSACWTRRTI